MVRKFSPAITEVVAPQEALEQEELLAGNCLSFVLKLLELVLCEQRHLSPHTELNESSLRPIGEPPRPPDWLQRSTQEKILIRINNLLIFQHKDGGVCLTPGEVFV
jgi:hypothetical protein